MALAHRPLTRRSLVVALLLSAIALFVFAALALAVGSGPPGFGETAKILLGAGDDPASIAVLKMRGMRVLLGILAGSALAAVGVTLQLLLRNPLADPYIVGVSGGAALVGSMAIIVVGHGPWVPPAAFLGAIAATFVTLGATRVGNRPPDVSILLVGVVINAFAAAVITFFKTLIEAQKAQEVLFWLVGFVGYPRGVTVVVVGFCVVLSVGVLIYLSPRLYLMALGDRSAARLGVDVERTRTLALLAASLATGAVVAETGLIGFIGLVVPHALRLVVGPDPRLLLPVAALVGGAVLCLVDAFARSLFLVFSSEPPVGAVCAAVGAPIFIILLRRHLRGSGR